MTCKEQRSKKDQSQICNEKKCKYIYNGWTQHDDRAMVSMETYTDISFHSARFPVYIYLLHQKIMSDYSLKYLESIKWNIIKCKTIQKLHGVQHKFWSGDLIECMVSCSAFKQ